MANKAYKTHKIVLWVKILDASIPQLNALGCEGVSH